MKILVVGSVNNHGGTLAPFITEQAEALRAMGCEVAYFGVKGKGVIGYLGCLKDLRLKIEDFKPDVVHAHFGLCGLLACLQSQVPVVTTFHGSDINIPKVMRLSKIAMRLSAWNIFVSKRTQAIAFAQVPQRVKRKSALVPCGINMPKAAEELPDMAHVLEQGKKHVLFSGAFDNAVKDPALAKQVVVLLPDAQLIELKGYNRDEVNALMYVCDAFLMTSKTEGSPQVVKEVMACGLPIVSVDVGDVRERVSISDGQLLEGCYVAKTREVDELAALLTKALAFGKRTDGRKNIEEAGLTNDKVAEKLIEIYREVKKECRKIR